MVVGSRRKFGQLSHLRLKPKIIDVFGTEFLCIAQQKSEAYNYFNGLKFIHHELFSFSCRLGVIHCLIHLRSFLESSCYDGCRLHNIILIYFIKARFHANKKINSLEHDSIFFGILYLIICNI